MIVRLKGNFPKQKRLLKQGFQFYDSPIKSRAGFSCIAARAVSFNSMIVRLKGLSDGSFKPRFEKFQFYDSPIKSVKTAEVRVEALPVSIL